MPSSQAHEGHEGHDHGPTEVAPPQVAPSEESPDIVTTPPPFETLENAPADSRAIPSPSYEREPAPSIRDWGQTNDRRLQTVDPSITPPREFDDLPRLQTAPRAFDEYHRDHQSGPRTYEDGRPPAAPMQGCEIGCPLDSSNVDRYGNRLLLTDTWNCGQQPSDCGLSFGRQVFYHHFDDGDCHASDVVRSHNFGINDHSYSCGYSDRY